MSWRATPSGETPRAWAKHALGWGLAAAIGLLFLLPNIVRIVSIGSYAAYSPFSARTDSSMVFDETFLYSAESNYTLTRGGAPGYDDTWEHRASIYPYSILPAMIEAGMAALFSVFKLGSLKLAHIASSFLFPFLSALVLAALFAKAGAGRVLSSTLALMTLMAFSPTTLVLGVKAFLLHTHGVRIFDTLQASRNPNPEITFLLFIAGLLLLTKAIRCGTEQTSTQIDARRSLQWAAGAGLVGGLLYFSYIYYAVSWTVMVGLLAAASLVSRRSALRGAVPRTVWLTLAVTVLWATLFLAWQHEAQVHGNYVERATRYGLYHLHAMAPGSVGETEFWGSWALVCAGIWLWLRRRGRHSSDALMPVLLAGMAGGLAGMNMQVVTGFNVQQVQHYPHMVLQPIGFLMVGVLVAMVSRGDRLWRAGAWVAFVLLMTAAVMAQVEAGRDSAPMHAVPAGERALFDWLNANSGVGSVVATNDLELCLMLPPMTHNSVLLAHGLATSASDDELMERLLFASRLEGVSGPELASELAGHLPPEHEVPLINYPLYLYEFSDRYQAYRAARLIAPRLVPGLIQQYETMNVAQELQRFRVDYIWKPAGAPPAIEGWQATAVFASDRGTLWQLVRL